MSNHVGVGGVVGQGTKGGVRGSKAVLDEAMRKQFSPGGEDKMNYGSVPMAPLIFQDDVINCVGGINEARLASAKINKVVNKAKAISVKLLELNLKNNLEETGK